MKVVNPRSKYGNDMTPIVEKFITSASIRVLHSFAKSVGEKLNLFRKLSGDSFVAIVCGGDFDRVFFRELVAAILDECTTRKLVPIIIDTTRPNTLEFRLAGLETLGKALSGILYLPAASSAEGRRKMIDFIKRTSRPVVIVDKSNDSEFLDTKNVKFSHYDNYKLSEAMRSILDAHSKDESVYWVCHESPMSENGKIRYGSYANHFRGTISCDPIKSRDDSYRKSLMHMISTNETSKCMTFVCLNDDIALGVDDAAFALHTGVGGHIQELPHIRIWSYDCTRSLMERRKTGDLKFICGGTVQDVSELARDSLDKIASLSLSNSAFGNDLSPKQTIIL
ncbi:LacI family DNA-binding transcriptional regulator [Magnetospirillum sp. J10]|uniref:LacI family DNA-binding transcriptional regulator n=2 Tax=Magnetospirillum sulfuroxidans TaxID=611300 RepID=A0ABS5IHI7_9PROT|nr:LacI family DNA-binding transcriptional regulator [Magnetospirillum sulfuroxidans]